MILHLATNTLVQSRMTQVSGDRYALSTVTSIRGTLQPVALDNVSLANGIYGRTFQFFCDGSLDIQTGDRMKDEDGVFYKVSDGGVVRRQFGAIDYKKIIIERE